MFSKLIKRQFKIEDITAVTYSFLSNNFVLHVTSEYDYYLCTPDKDEFLRYILYVQKRKNMPPLKFYFVEDVDMQKYTKYEGEKVEKLPKVEPKVYD